MMNKEKKQTYITEMPTQFDKSEAVIVAHYQGLTVKQIDELRSEMRNKGILFKITKNRITKLALEGSKYKKLENLFSGPTAVAFSEDAITSAKILTKLAKKNSNLNKLITKIKSRLKNKFTTTEDILITRERHRQNLINCVQHLEKFEKKKNNPRF